MRDLNILTLFKNKDSLTGISMLSIVRNLLAQIVLNRPQVVADRIYPESQETCCLHICNSFPPTAKTSETNGEVLICKRYLWLGNQPEENAIMG